MYTNQEKKKTKFFVVSFDWTKHPEFWQLRISEVILPITSNKKNSSSISFYATNIQKKIKRKTKKIVQWHLHVELKVKIKMNLKRIRWFLFVFAIFKTLILDSTDWISQKWHWHIHTSELSSHSYLQWRRKYVKFLEGLWSFEPLAQIMPLFKQRLPLSIILLEKLNIPLNSNIFNRTVLFITKLNWIELKPSYVESRLCRSAQSPQFISFAPINYLISMHWSKRRFFFSLRQVCTLYKLKKPCLYI